MQAVAIHEAAHAVMAMVLGLPLAYVTVNPEGPHAMIELEGAPSPRMRPRLVTYFFAGPAATYTFTPEAKLGDEADANRASELGGERMMFRGKVRALCLVAKKEKVIRRVAEELRTKGKLS